MSNKQKTWVDQITETVKEVAGSLKTNVRQPACDLIDQIPFDHLKNTYYLPLSKEYDKWPESFTNFKYNNILTLGNENQRLIFLGFSTLAAVSITKKFSSGIFPIIRNSVVTYFSLGLVVAPEVYNPLLVKKNINKK